MIRSRQWKLVYCYEDQGLEPLRPLRDIGETTDLSAVSGRSGCAVLRRELQRWLDELDAPLATLREGNAPIRARFTGTSYADGKITGTATT